jgi:hypothetical protein
MSQIHFNGKTYNNLAEMPSTEREAYDQLMAIFKDEDQDGTPDIFQGDVVGNIIEVVKKASGNSEGVTALEQMSPEMRARISKGIAKLYELGLISGSPDLPKEWPFSSSGKILSLEDTEIRPSQPLIQSPSVIQEDTGPRWLLVAAIFAGVGICVVGVAVFIIARGGF